ncbi:class I adenylate-forming enzyme family protein [Neorhodopirellula pilleata]|uniref:Long-chain-fatty-acid--CoA ligase n=1 Tax=Neorhodopirellula pilleata TaxID=2714738 RepID=A0A5C6A6I1_9BACT|nr:class I adenylate-forming enzyme family protein [Neorhodopirellula pilleata]TWT95504.1 Long-chain-fatty-acid--CoA ligase [Neorhodopirellula pilleata]
MTTDAETNDRHLLDAMLRHARHRSDSVAIRDASGRALNWGELAVRVFMQSESLSNDTPRSVTNSDRITNEVRNTIDDVVLALACLAAGVIEIAIDARFPESVRHELIRRSAGTIVPSLKRIPPDQACDPSSVRASIDVLTKCADSIAIDAPSLVLWTSGTTAKPRGVTLSPRNLFTNAVAKLRAVPQSTDDHRLSVLPISHAYARTCDMGTWLLSGGTWTIDSGTQALDRINDSDPPTHINGVPSIARTICERLHAGDEKLSRLRVLGCGGAALDHATFERIQRRGVMVIQGYGCTETSPVIFSARATSADDQRPGCVGELVDGWEIRVQESRLFVRGPGVMLGYLDEPKATAQKIDQDGWLDTGDLVEQIDGGKFRILGRADDVIVLDNGFKIHPQMIEPMINALPDVRHAIILTQPQELIVAIEPQASGKSWDRSAVESVLADYLPPGTKRRIELIDPPLSHERQELTAKGTPKRNAVAARLKLKVDERPKPFGGV